jgi:predicted dehydrogenase
MKQVFLTGKGEIETLEVPIPCHLSNSLLVRNICSVISTGTEGAAVSRSGGWIGVAEKALQSKDRMQQVWKMAQTQGINKTWETVQRKLEDYTAIGYSCVGRVVEVSGSDLSFQPGDLVACIGTGFATHAEYVVVPSNLAVLLPSGVDCAEGAFGALACIAMQGIRRLELTPGEIVGVIGLGLIGQIASQLLVGMGYQAVGMDIIPDRAAKAKELAGIEAWSSQDADSISRVQELTNGRGLDGVLICAATESDGLINLAFDLCRQRGRVSLVGDVGLGLSRSKIYQKELELRVSCSYGPGRYDPEYEIHGRDYPFSYVRWTEKRNLEYVLQLLHNRKINLTPLINYRVTVDRAIEGYAKIKEGDTQIYGVVIDYSNVASEAKLLTTADYTRRSSMIIAPANKGIIRLGVIGCGGFTKNVHLPNLLKLKDRFQIVGLATRTGSTAEIIGRKVGASIATSDYRVLLADPNIDAVLVATRHASHGKMVADSLRAGKHVFVEKPMCIDIEEGEEIVELASKYNRIVRVGFNRRFSPYLNGMRQVIGTQGQRLFSCRVNIGAIKNDWSNTLAEGGRLMGEGVHFFDLCNWFMRQHPSSLSATVVGEVEYTNPNIVVNLNYPDGSVASVIYTSVGSAEAGKERFEAFGNGRTAICDDYTDLKILGTSNKTSKMQRGDKGHLGELEEFASAIIGQSYPIDGADAYDGLLATKIVLSSYESSINRSCIDLLSVR